MSHRHGFTPDEQKRFAEWATFQRETNLAAMARSAVVISIFDDGGELNIDFALQIGAMILLEKPILLLVHPGQKVPEKLRLVADEILEVSPDDIDTEAPELREKIQAFGRRYVNE